MSLVKQQGTAVVMAILMVAIAAAIAIGLIMHQQISIMRTKQIVQARQMFFYSRGALYWAKDALREEVAEDQQWPMVLPETQLPGGVGRVQAQLTDYAQLINVNDLSDAQSEEKLLQLLVSGDDIKDDQAQSIVAAIKAWVDGQPSAQFDDYYMSLSPAYRAAHMPMVSVSELRLVSGVTPQIFEFLRNQVAAYPAGDENNLYLLATNIELQGQIFTQYSVLQRNVDKGKVQLKVVWQSQGAL